MEYFRDWPFPAAVATLFVVVFLRANATYWIGRASRRGAARTRFARLLQSPAFERGQRLVVRWGAPVVTLSFLTIGIQTVVNLAAGVARMPLRRYLPAMAVGGVVWAVLYATVGFVTFAAWRALYAVSPVAAVALLVVLAAALAAFVVRQVRARPEPADHAQPHANVKA